MNKDIERSLNNLNNEILENEAVKTYVFLKNEIKNDKKLTKIKKELLYLKKCEMTLEEKERYSFLENEYNSNPLIKNLKIAEKEVIDLVKSIKKELNI